MKAPLRILGSIVALVPFAIIAAAPVAMNVTPVSAATAAPLHVTISVARVCPTATPKDDPGHSGDRGADPDKGKASPHPGECATPKPAPTPHEDGTGHDDVIFTATPTPAPDATPTPTDTPNPGADHPTPDPHPSHTPA